MHTSGHCNIIFYFILFNSLFFFSGLLLGFILDVFLEKIGHDSHSEMTEEMLDALAQQHQECQLASQEVDTINTSHNEIDTKTVEIDMDADNIKPTEIVVESDRKSKSSERSSSMRHSRYGNIPVNNDQIISESEKKKLLRVSIVTGIALSVHNFPEGLATFTAAMDSSKMGITLGIAMIIHDCPEGMAVAIPTFFATKSKTLSILVTAISGISQPIGALFAWLIIKDGVSDFVYGVLFGLVGGIMTMITLEELLPSAIKYDPEDVVTTKALMIGMGVVALILAFL